MSPPRPRVLVPAIVLAVLLGACGGAGGGPPSAPSGGSTGATEAGAALRGELRVFAAASLTDAFEALEDRFEARHPGLDVVLNLAGSNRLAAQLLEGAEADVFAPADLEQMEVVVEAGLAREPVVFAENLLELAVEPGNPRGVEGLADLAREDLVVVLPSEAVPAGAYAAQALARAGVEAEASSYELDVRAALTKVVLGEADLAVVYHSDVVARPEAVEGVEIPEAANVVARYPIAVLEGSEHVRAAEAFVSFVRSETAAEVLRELGFSVPS